MLSYIYEITVKKVDEANMQPFNLAFLIFRKVLFQLQVSLVSAVHKDTFLEEFLQQGYDPKSVANSAAITEAQAEALFIVPAPFTVGEEWILN